METIVLHRFQEDAVNKVLEKNTERMVVITAPCGAGKTIIAVELVRRYVRGNSGQRAYIVTPNRSIMGQFLSCLRSYDLRCHVYDPNADSNSNVDYEVRLYTKFMLTSKNDDCASIKSRVPKPGNGGLWVFDEVHELCSPQRKWLFSHVNENNIRRVGLTATWSDTDFPVETYRVNIQDILNLVPPRIMLPEFEIVNLCSTDSRDHLEELEKLVPADEPCIVYVPKVTAQHATAVQKVKNVATKIGSCEGIHGMLEGGYDEILDAWVAMCENFPWGDDESWTNRSWWELMRDPRTLRYLQKYKLQQNRVLKVGNAWSSTLEATGDTHTIGPFDTPPRPDDIIITRDYILTVKGFCVDPHFVHVAGWKSRGTAETAFHLAEDKEEQEISAYMVLRRPRSSLSSVLHAPRSKVPIVPAELNGHQLRWGKTTTWQAPFPAMRFYIGQMREGVFMPFYMNGDASKLPSRETIWIEDQEFPSSGAGHHQIHDLVFRDGNAQSSNQISAKQQTLTGRVYRIGLPGHMVKFLCDQHLEQQQPSDDGGAGTGSERTFQELYWRWAEFILSDQQLIFLRHVLQGCVSQLHQVNGNHSKMHRLNELHHLGFLNHSGYCDPVLFCARTRHWISRLQETYAFPADMRTLMCDWSAGLQDCSRGVNPYSFVPEDFNHRLVRRRPSTAAAAAAAEDTVSHAAPTHIGKHMCATAELLSTGLNVPELRRIIMVDPDKSQVKFVQMIGRVMRYRFNKPRPCVTIVQTTPDNHGKYEQLKKWFISAVSADTNLRYVIADGVTVVTRKRKKR